MNGQPPSSYAVKLRPYSDKYSHTTPGKYLEVPIPDEIEQFGLEQGDTVYMDFESADDPSYLKIRFADTGTRHDLRLKHRNDLHPKHAVTLPTEFTVHRDDNPFQGIAKDDTVNVEFSHEPEPEIRVYTEDGYRKRTAQLVLNDQTPTLKAPVLAPVLSRFTDRYVDLAANTPFEGQKFRIIPFDGLDDIWLRENTNSMRGRVHPSGEVFRDVWREQGVPTKRVRKLTISWNPDPEGGTKPDRVVELFSKRWTKGCKVVLPAKGRFIFEAETKHGEGSTWAVGNGYREKQGDMFRQRWNAAYSDAFKKTMPGHKEEKSEHDRNDPLTVFIPTPSRGETGETEIIWYWD